MEIEAKRRLERKARSLKKRVFRLDRFRGAPSLGNSGKSVDLLELYRIFDRLKKARYYFINVRSPWQKQKL